MNIFTVRLRPDKTKEVTDMEDKQQSSKIHHKFVEDLSNKNIILFGGPIVDKVGGMLVVNLPSREDVEKTFSQDPMINKGYVTIEISEWNIKHNLENFKKLL